MKKFNIPKLGLVTGGCKGIGLAILDHVSRRMDIIPTHCTSLDEDPQFHLDISDVDSINNFDIRGVNILINNAGISQRKDFLDLTVADMDNMWQVNLRGAMLLTQRVLPQMIEQGYGRIINIASIGGVTCGVEQLHYASAKAGLINFTKSIAKVYGKYGITCNCISPGLIATDMLGNYSESDLTRRIPCGRIGTPDDVAKLVSAIIEQDYLNGQNIILDGGMTLT